MYKRIKSGKKEPGYLQGVMNEEEGVETEQTISDTKSYNTRNKNNQIS